MLPQPDERKLWKHGLPKCAHRDSTPVLILTAAGARAVREQCAACGKLDTAPLRLADHPAAPPVDQPRADAWLAARKEAGESAQAAAQKRYAMRQAAKADESEDWWARYDEYLSGDAWARVRAMVLHRDGNRCQAALPGCTRTAIQAHHISQLGAYAYQDHIGQAPLHTMIGVCVACHDVLTQADRAIRAKKA